MSRCTSAFALAMLLASPGFLRGEIIPVPNGSFESPTALFVNLNIDSWQRTPKPDWYAETNGYTWSQLTGAFKNTPVGNFDHIDNCDGNQAVWTFVVPGAGLFQDYNSVDWNDTAPTHAFDARYEVGKSYRLTVGVIGMGGGMSNGATAQISLYFRDAASNQVTVAAASITNSPTVFSNRTHLVDFSANVPTVRVGDAWAGQHIGIQILSTVTTNLQGGYWAFDNVRLESFATPVVILTAVPESSGLRISWPSATGYAYQVQSSANLSAWADVDAPQAGTGDALSKLIPAAERTNLFVRVLANPSP